MKKNISDNLTLSLKVFIPTLILSACFAFLYYIDIITPFLFYWFTQVLGVLFYIVLAFLLNKFIPKRTLVIQIIIVILLLVVYFLTQAFELLSFLLFSGKLLVFIVTLLLIKKKAK